MCRRAAIIVSLVVLAVSAASDDVGAVEADACPQAQSDWNHLESWVWTSLCSTGGALVDTDGSGQFGSNFVAKQEDVDRPDRVIRADVLHTMLTEAPYRDALVGRPIRLGDFEVDGQLDLDGATHADAISVTNVRFKDSVSARGANLGTVTADARFDESLDLSSASIDGVLNLAHSRLRRLAAEGLRVSGGLDLSGVKADDELALFGAAIGGFVDLGSAAVLHDVDLSSSSIGGNLAVDRDTTVDRLFITDARVGGSVLIRERSKLGLLEAIASHVGTNVEVQHARVDEANLDGADVDGSVFLRQASVRTANLFGVDVAGDLQLMGSLFDERLNLRGAVVAGDFALASGGVAARWGLNAMLDLRGTEVGSISDDQLAWAPRLVLQGFVYGSLNGPLSNRDSFGNRDEHWYIEWLSRQQPFTSQPFTQLESMLRDAGHPDLADDIAFARYAREQRQKSGPEIPLGYAHRWLSGYGYEPLRAAGFAVILVVLGWAILRLFSCEKSRRDAKMRSPLIYSLDRLIPLVTLERDDKEVDLRAAVSARWVCWYFYFHTAFGYVLGALLVVALGQLSFG